MKGLVFINQLHLNYTSEMEKAMHRAHGVGYQVYCLNQDVRISVEKKREQEYLKSQQIVAQFDRKIHS